MLAQIKEIGRTFVALLPAAERDVKTVPYIAIHRGGVYLLLVKVGGSYYIKEKLRRRGFFWLPPSPAGKGYWGKVSVFPAASNEHIIRGVRRALAIAEAEAVNSGHDILWPDRGMEELHYLYTNNDNKAILARLEAQIADEVPF